MPLSDFIDPSGEAKAEMPELDPEDPEYAQQKSDQLYFQSFGPGKFSPNNAGSLTFSPDSRPLPGSSNQDNPQVQASQGISQGQVTGRNQIRSLQQLAAVSKALSGVPEELRSRILSHLLGIPYKGPREQALESAMLEAKAKYQMGEPDRRIQQARMAQTAQGQQQQREFQQKMAKMMLQFRKEGRTGAEANRTMLMELHRDNAKNTIANSIANLTRAMEATVDPQQKIAIGKLLQQQHQLYTKFEKLSPLDESQTSGQPGGASGGTNDLSGAAQ